MHVLQVVSWFDLYQGIVFKDLFIIRERPQEQEGQKEREREPQADSTLSTEPLVGFDLTTLRSWPEPKPGAIRLTECATQATPREFFE